MKGLRCALLFAAVVAANANGNALAGGGTATSPAYSAAALYNAANAFARAGKPGMAVLYYERAALLAPRDPDIEANLRLVRQSARLPPETTDAAPLTRLAGPTAVAIAGIAGVLMTGAAGLLIRVRGIRGRGRPMLRGAIGGGGLAGLALIGLTVGNAVLIRPRLQMGVVIVDGAAARVAPVPLGDALFALREAETVRLDASHEGFFLVRTQRGQTGWVAQAEVAPVVPERGG